MPGLTGSSLAKRKKAAYYNGNLSWGLLKLHGIQEKWLNIMPEVIINGPAGRIEGRYHHNNAPNAPIALFLHPHPQHGGTMNNKVIYTLYYMFVRRGFSCLRFNFRGVGRSQGTFSRGEGELSDAAAALDWLQSYNENASQCWISGFSFGAWIGMQLLMRRPEIAGFYLDCTASQHVRLQFSRSVPIIRYNGDRYQR